MSGEAALSVLQEGLLLVSKLAAPILILSMAVGIIIAVFQAATSINEQTLTFVPFADALDFVMWLRSANVAAASD